MLEVAKHFLIGCAGCAKLLGRGVKMCICFHRFMRPYVITARIVFYPHLKDKSFAYVVGEGLVENCVGAFLFPLALPVCVCVRESCYGEQRVGRTLIFAHKTNLAHKSYSSWYCLFSETYVHMYIFIWNIYICTQSRIFMHTKLLWKKGYVTCQPVKQQASRPTELFFCEWLSWWHYLAIFPI